MLFESVLGVLGVLLGVMITLFWRKFYQSTNSGDNIHAIKAECVRLATMLENKTLVLEEVSKERIDLQSQLISTKAGMAAIERENELLKQQLLTWKQETNQLSQNLVGQFELVASKILEEKSKQVTALQHQTMDSILLPLKDKIQSFEEKVQRVYDQEAAERNMLKGELKYLMELNKQMHKDALNLTNALKGDSKIQGIWGEFVLQRLLEKSGLVKDREYRMQVSMVNSDARRYQPDVVVDLPEGRCLVVDAKVSMVAYERYMSAESDTERQHALKEHMLSVKKHIAMLAEKKYASVTGLEGVDFVLLFMPIEPAFTLAVQNEPQLFVDAFDKNIVMVSPTTLLVTLRTIATMWRQEYQSRNASEIAKKAGDMYDKFVGFTNDLMQIGQKINDTQKAYDNALNKLSTGNGNLIKRSEELKKLGAKAGKSISSSFISNEHDESPPLLA